MYVIWLLTDEREEPKKKKKNEVGVGQGLVDVWGNINP